AHLVDDTELDLGVGVDRVDRLGEALQAIHAGDQDVLHAPVLQLRQHIEPELRAFVFRQPEPQQLLVAFQVNAQRQIDCLVDDLPVLADLHHDTVEVQDGIDRVQRPRLPFHHTLQNAVGDLGDQGG